MTPDCPGRRLPTRILGLCLTCARLDLTANASFEAPAFVQPSGVWACESLIEHSPPMARQSDE